MKKFRFIPKAVFNTSDPVGDLIDKMRGGKKGGDNSQDTEYAVVDTENKEKVIPKSVLSTEEDLEDIKKLLRSGKPIAINDDGSFRAVGQTRQGGNSRPKNKVVPKSTLSVRQWYETNRTLYYAEIEAMRKEMNNPTLNPKFDSRGYMYWPIRYRPNLGRKYNTMTYDLILRYDADHPHRRMGSSIRVYPKNPTIEEMQRIVNSIPTVYPKHINHTLIDEKGKRFLCTSAENDTSADNRKGITSAVTSYRFAQKWLTAFEVGLRDKEIWADLQKHGIL